MVLRLFNFFANSEQTHVSLSSDSAIFKNINIDFSLSHHFQAIIAAIDFAHDTESELALAIL
jgi:hypothetical protein